MNYTGTTELHTDRLVLRRFTLNDAPEMFGNWASDPEVTKYLTWPAHRDISDTQAILKLWEAEYSGESFFQWAIVFNGECIGSISVVNLIDDYLRLAHIGYCIGKKWWHKGITTEALRRVMEFLFEEVGVNCVQSRHDPRNPNSGAVMKKCGMTYDGTLRRCDINNQGICDACYYSITAEEYFSGKPESL